MAIRKPRLRYLLLAGMLFACSAQGAQNSIEIKNRVAACIEMTPLDRSNLGTLPVVIVEVNIKKSEGECGCMSAALMYEVTVGPPKQSFQLIRGVLGTLNLSSGKIQLPLALSSDLIDGRNLRMSFYCRPPE